MHRDLLDALRCPAPHEESWLVAVVHRAEGPALREVDLACPQCQREFTVRGGVADFRFDDTRNAVTQELAQETPLEVPRATAPSTPDALRLAALLGLSPDAGPMSRPVLLAGAAAAMSDALRALLPVPQVLVNSHAAPESGSGAAISVLRVGTRLPLGVATLDAAALDAAHHDPTFVASVVRAIRAKGRLVAPRHLPLPDGVQELARDEHEWVGEVMAQASGLVELRRQVTPDI